MLHVLRTGRLVGHISPCLPSRAERPPTGREWLYEIKRSLATAPRRALQAVCFLFLAGR